MINLFIDSNIWLDLYHFSSNDLEEFSKLKDMINKEIILFMPTQVIFEINRNRDSKIDDAYRKFRDFKADIPNLCKGYSEYATFLALYSDIKKIHKELIDKVSNDIISYNLPADRLIFEINNLSTNIADTPEIIQKADLRFKRGNPPGKENSLGDAIIWETLLFEVKNTEELFFISADKDYRNKFNDEFNSFLKHEWETTKKSKIYFYSSLSGFLKEHKIDINLRTEDEKNDLIYKLSFSGSFAWTHDIIYKLSNYEYFNDEQLNMLLNIASNNNQVGYIIKDNDVWAFYRKIIKGREDKIERNENINELLKILEIGE